MSVELINLPSTYSLMAKNSNAELVGIITQSKYLAIGSLVQFFNDESGLIVVQGKPEEKIATDIFKLYHHRCSAREAIKEVEEQDEFSDYRQIAFLPFLGDGCIFTGDKLKEVKFGIVKPNCISIGNFLKNTNVIYSIIEKFEAVAKNDKFSKALLEGLKMGLKNGGEKRGQQSAAIKIWKKHESRYLKIMDLRVDDSEYAIEELEKLIQKYYLYMTPGNLSNAMENCNEVQKVVGKVLEAAKIRYSDLGEKITLENLYRIENLENKWISKQFIDRDAFNFLKSKFLQ
ncbi:MULTISPECIES: DUF1028 domain-containing protein [Lactobacillaceae]|uniref:DUF1028 domain-containing protein n=1 Tax=Lactobacillaceae TaxID=33958 RepID=UPI00128B1002|nr:MULTISPECIES: DUF1028 domain-containing protein [Lactobacillaceae]MCC4487562.1 DUF1028 domain-containing protein [Limosilactobacillus reuteri]MQB77515.1 hypothetical protein [Limosilactobacillus reuteri]MQB99545.1 hypothetical protein [Limosilactobacillus reuteri]